MSFLQSTLGIVFIVISAVLPLYIIPYVHLLVLSRKYKPPPKTVLNEYPTVSVHLPLYNEKHVVARLLNAVCNIDYPREKLEIIVVDDSTDETTSICAELVNKFREQGVNVVHVRRGSRVGFKAGALQHALRISKGEFIAVFDADFVPQADFLKKIMTYFADEKVGVVQARWGHLNREYSILTAAQALSLDLHFVVEQKGRMAGGLFLNFNGTAGVWRRKCVEDAGGWVDSLAEDLDLSYRAQLKGWKIVYVDDLVVPAEIPVQMKAVRRQQYRWAYGAVQTTQRYIQKIVTSSNPLAVKIHAVTHLTRHLPQLLLVAQLFMIPLVAKSLPTRLEWMVGWVALYPMLLTASLLVTSKTVIGAMPSPRFLKDVFAAFLWGLGMSVNNALAVVYAFLRRYTVFERTPKFGLVGRHGEWKNSDYVVRQDPYLLFDFAVGTYAVYASLYCFYSQAYMFLPLTMVLGFALLYTGFASIMQRPSKNTEGKTRKLNIVITIFSVSFVTAFAVYSYASTVHPIEESIASLERASTSVDITEKAKKIQQVLNKLPAEGNPVWLFPTTKTDYALIKHDLQKIHGKLTTFRSESFEFIHALAEDVRHSLHEVELQLKTIRPFVWMNAASLTVLLLAGFSVVYSLVKET